MLKPLDSPLLLAPTSLTLVNDACDDLPASYLVPGAEAKYATTGAAVGAHRTFLYVVPGIIVEELVALTDNSHT